jgi:rhamnosyltransferase subunit B
MNIGMVALGSIGDLIPFVRLAILLKSLGHDVLVFGDTQSAFFFEKNQIAFKPLVSLGKPEDIIEVSRFFIRKDWMIDMANGLLPTLSDMDCFIVHPFATGVHPLLNARQLPWMGLMPSPGFIFSIYHPPIVQGMPNISRIMRIHPLVARFFFQMKRRSKRTRDCEIQYFEGARAIGDDSGVYWSPNYFSRFANIAFFSKRLSSIQKDWPKSRWIQGFIGDNTGMKPSDEVMRFMKDGKKPVVVTLGSNASLEKKAIMNRVVQILLERDERILVLGNGFDYLSSARVKTVDFEPLPAILPWASFVVHHGGSCTLHDVMIAKKYSLVLPIAYDQFTNAFSLERIGIAKSLLWNKTPEAIEKAVSWVQKRALNDDFPDMVKDIEMDVQYLEKTIANCVNRKEDSLPTCM